MSRTLNEVAVTLFDSEVKQAYQALMATLAGTTTERKGIVGGEYKFRKIGKGSAQEKTAPSADVVPMNLEHSLVTCTLGDWYAAEYTDIFGKAEVNFDEVREIALTIAGALGRRDDQLKIDAMAAGSFAASPTDAQGGLVTTAIGGADTNLNVAKLREIAAYFNDQDVENARRHIAVSSNGLKGLLGETEVTSTDYNTVKALVNGEINTFMGFQFHVIGSRAEGGLPISGSVRDGFAWHEEAIGYANGLDMVTMVDWIGNKQSWLSQGLLKAGAVIRDIKGVVKYQATEA